MKPWLAAALWAALLMPLGIVAHEAAHYVGYLIYGMPDPSLSYSYSGFAGLRDFWTALKSGDREAAAAIADIQEVGVTALLGVLTTFTFGGIGLALLIARRSVFGGALAFTSLFRFAAIGLLYAIGNPENSDEAHIAITLGIPGVPLLLAGVFALLFTTWRLGRDLGLWAMLAIFGATLGSLALWMGVLGPVLMP